VLGVALDHGHRGLHAVHDRALLVSLDERGETAFAEGLDQSCGIGHGRKASGGAAPDANVHGREVVLEQTAEVATQPRHAGELERVRDLVEGDPGHEALPVDVHLTGRARDVGAHEQQPGGPLVPEQRQVVLTEHARREEADHQADLGGEGGLGRNAQGAGEWPGADQALLEALSHRRQELGQGLDVGLGPFLAKHRLGVWKVLGGYEPGEPPHLVLGARRPLVDVAGQGLAGIGAGGEASDLTGEGAVQHLRA
jgi:hypothetical protein